jgi:hypothetical protein
MDVILPVLVDPAVQVRGPRRLLPRRRKEQMQLTRSDQPLEPRRLIVRVIPTQAIRFRA